MTIHIYYECVWGRIWVYIHVVTVMHHTGCQAISRRLLIQKANSKARDRLIGKFNKLIRTRGTSTEWMGQLRDEPIKYGCSQCNSHVHRWLCYHR